MLPLTFATNALASGTEFSSTGASSKVSVRIVPSTAAVAASVPRRPPCGSDHGLARRWARYAATLVPADWIPPPFSLSVFASTAIPPREVFGLTTV